MLLQGILAGAGNQALELLRARFILLWPGYSGQSIPRRRVIGSRMQGEIGIGEVRSRQRHQVGAPRCDQGIDLVGAGNGTHRHGGDARFVADLLGEHRLVHAAVDRARSRVGLAGGAVDEVAAACLEQLCRSDGIRRAEAAGHPVGERQAHRHGLVGRPQRAHGVENFEWITQAVFQRPAIFVLAPVGNRGDKGREQIAVRHVQFEHVKAAVDSHARRGDVLVAHAVHVGTVHFTRHLRHAWVIRQRRGRQDRPVAFW